MICGKVRTTPLPGYYLQLKQSFSGQTVYLRICPSSNATVRGRSVVTVVVTVVTASNVSRSCSGILEGNGRLTLRPHPSSVFVEPWHTYKWEFVSNLHRRPDRLWLWNKLQFAMSSISIVRHCKDLLVTFKRPSPSPVRYENLSTD